MIIIGDIAGQFEALLRLVSKFHSKEKFVLVGDLIDRGPQSKEVVEWAMKSKNVIALKGNHEHMFVDWHRNILDLDYQPIYEGGLWLENGGISTIRSYDMDYGPMFRAAFKVPIEHIEWLNKLPLNHQESGFFISHAPWLQQVGLSEMDYIWNRDEPSRMHGVIQVFGHNSFWGLRRFVDERGLWAMCIDQSKREVLTAFDTNDKMITVEPYVERYREVET